jgi:class 3 adenylate cyclase
MAGATIVFCDIVGFSRHDNFTQERMIYDLSAEITHELYRYVSSPAPHIISLPTGDGMALAFMDSVQNPIDWRPIIFSLLDRLMRWSRERHQLRVGVHTGVVSIITDINRRPNICGAVINECQRIMDAAQPNQILFSKEAFNAYIGNNMNQYVNNPCSGPPKLDTILAVLS